MNGFAAARTKSSVLSSAPKTPALGRVVQLRGVLRAVQHFRAALTENIYSAIGSKFMHVSLGKNKTSHGSKRLVFAENYLKNCTYCWPQKRTRSREGE